MSLDVYLTMEGIETEPRQAIFVREDGQTKEISREAWDRLHPDREPITTPVGGTSEVFSANITHNLNRMAEAAGIYGVVWCPEEHGIAYASQLIDFLDEGIKRLRADPERFKRFNPTNGWGSYDGLVRFLEEYLAACKAYPEARVDVWR